MKANISARGYTSVILIMNMKRFVAQDERNDFETLRGKREFANVLRTNWPQAMHLFNAGKSSRCSISS